MSIEKFKTVITFNYGEDWLSKCPLTKTQLRAIKTLTRFNPEYLLEKNDVCAGSFYKDNELEWILIKLQPIMEAFRKKQEEGYF